MNAPLNKRPFVYKFRQMLYLFHQFEQFFFIQPHSQYLQGLGRVCDATMAWAPSLLGLSLLSQSLWKLCLRWVRDGRVPQKKKQQQPGKKGHKFNVNINKNLDYGFVWWYLLIHSLTLTVRPLVVLQFPFYLSSDLLYQSHRNAFVNQFKWQLWLNGHLILPFLFRKWHKMIQLIAVSVSWCITS